MKGSVKPKLQTSTGNIRTQSRILINDDVPSISITEQLATNLVFSIGRASLDNSLCLVSDVINENISI